MGCRVHRRAFQHDPGTRTRSNPYGWRCRRRGAGSGALLTSLDTSQSGQLQKCANYVSQRTDRPTGGNLLTERMKITENLNEKVRGVRSILDWIPVLSAAGVLSR
jgi:hypothetical protein